MGIFDKIAALEAEEQMQKEIEERALHPEVGRDTNEFDNNRDMLKVNSNREYVEDVVKAIDALEQYRELLEEEDLNASGLRAVNIGIRNTLHDIGEDIPDELVNPSMESSIHSTNTLLLNQTDLALESISNKFMAFVTKFFSELKSTAYKNKSRIDKLCSNVKSLNEYVNVGEGKVMLVQGSKFTYKGKFDPAEVLSRGNQIFMSEIGTGAWLLPLITTLDRLTILMAKSHSTKLDINEELTRLEQLANEQIPKMWANSGKTTKDGIPLLQYPISDEVTAYRGTLAIKNGIVPTGYQLQCRQHKDISVSLADSGTIKALKSCGFNLNQYYLNFIEQVETVSASINKVAITYNEHLSTKDRTWVYAVHGLLLIGLGMVTFSIWNSIASIVEHVAIMDSVKAIMDQLDPAMAGMFSTFSKGIIRYETVKTLAFTFVLFHVFDIYVNELEENATTIKARKLFDQYPELRRICEDIRQRAGLIERELPLKVVTAGTDTLFNFVLPYVDLVESGYTYVHGSFNRGRV